MKGFSTKLGAMGEQVAVERLRREGFDAYLADLQGRFDLYVDGAHVEVKTSSRRKDGNWGISGYPRWLMPDQPDAFIFIFLDVPRCPKALFLVVPPPLRRTTISITYSALRTTYRQYWENWGLLDQLCEKAFHRRYRPNLKGKSWHGYVTTLNVQGCQGIGEVQGSAKFRAQPTFMAVS